MASNLQATFPCVSCLLQIIISMKFVSDGTIDDFSELV